MGSKCPFYQRKQLLFWMCGTHSPVQGGWAAGGQGGARDGNHRAAAGFNPWG